MNKIDHLVTADENRRLGLPEVKIPETTPEPVIQAEPVSDVQDNVEPVQEPQEHQQEQLSDPYLDEQPKQEEKVSKESSVDEYGNPVKSKKVYTEEEVQKMIRDRVSRIKGASQPQTNYEDQIKTSYQQQTQQQVEQQEDNWEKQLESFIDKHLEQKTKSEQLRAWQEKELQRQTEFEQKFSMGMERYSDFKEVVSGKPITDSMMLSIRNLDNPAAFVYGASKLHPAEIDRIARIEDPYVQAAEMGKLHERMIKDRKIASSAPKPIEPVKGDLGLKNSTNAPTNYAASDYQSYITQRVNEYAQQKRR